MTGDAVPPGDEAVADSAEPVSAETPASTGTAPARRAQLSWGESVMTLATPFHYLSLAVGFAILLYLDRRLWFIADVFDFFGRMQPGHSLALFAPHNEHWSTIPILLFLAVYKVVGLHSYVPYLVLDLLAHIAVAHLLWRWMLRVGTVPWVATALATAFLILGGGVENLTSAFQISFVLPVALGLLGALLLDYAGPTRWARDAGFWPVAVAAIMCSGIGTGMVALGAVVVLLRRGWRVALRAAAPPAAIYVIWLVLAAGNSVSTTPAPKWELPQIVQYVWNGLTSAIDGTTGWTGLGGVLALGLAVWLYRHRRLASGKAALAFAGPLVALPFFAVIGVGRIALGVSESSASRYGYIWVVLLLPATALALTQFTRRSVTARWLTLGLSFVVAVNGLAGILIWLQNNSPSVVDAHGQILAAAHLMAGGAPLAVDDSGAVEPVHSPNLTVGILRSMLDAGELPMDTPVTAQDMLDASLYIQVSVTGAPLLPTSAPPAVGEDVSPPSTTGGGTCVSLADVIQPAQLQLVFASGASIAVTPTNSGDIGVQLAPQGIPLDLTAPHDFPVTAGETVYLNVTASGVAALLSLPPGATAVCGVTP
jgi:hypothetical protein